MKEISTIQEAEEYIYTYDFFGNLNENREALLPVLKSCEELALQSQRHHVLCRARTFLIYLYIEENKLDIASDLATQNLKYAREQNLEDELLYMIAIIAHLYQLTGNYSASEELIQIALDKLNTITEDKRICKLYMMIAEQYSFTNDHEKCKDTYEKCIHYALKTNDHALIAVCYNNYADKLLKAKELEHVKIVLAKGFEQASLSENESILSMVNGNYGYFYLLSENYEQAKQYLTEAIRYYKQHNIVSKAMLFYIDLAKTHFKLLEYDKGYELLNELEAAALSSSANYVLADTYQLIVEYHEFKKDYWAALQYLKKYVDIHARIKNEESEEKIRNLQITHEVKTIQNERDHSAKLARIKHDFLANMSHEIRTPVNSILGICYLLQQDILSDKQKSYIHRLNHSGELLLGIINDVLDISKIEAGKFQLLAEPFSIRQLAENIYQTLSIKAVSKGILLELQIDDRLPEFCLGDMTRLGQILTNLLFNAIKFTEKGSVSLQISLQTTDENNVVITFSIADTGIGMSAEQIQKIFHEYEQADNLTQQKFGGTGLGLSISKKLIELMNGVISVKSEVGTGSVFTVDIPFESYTTIPGEFQEPVISGDTLAGKLIYIADDVEENRLVMQELLSSLQDSVKTKQAANGKELLILVDEQTPDIIMIDLDMPEMNGFEAAGILRKKFSGESPRIVACTASLLTMSKEELLECGFHQLLLKPYTIKQLAEAIL